MSLSTVTAVDEQWSRIADFYNAVSPQHRQEPMKALIAAINEAGVKNLIWPAHFHFTLVVSADNSTCCDVNAKIFVSAEFWHEVNKFQIRYHNIQGVLYDEKWCEFDKAWATLRHIFRLMRDDA